MSRSASSVIDVILEQCSPEPEAEVLDVRVGPYWTIVKSSVGAGMASTMAGSFDRQVGVPVEAAGGLLDLEMGALLQLLRSSSVPEAAVGLAGHGPVQIIEAMQEAIFHFGEIFRKW